MIVPFGWCIHFPRCGWTITMCIDPLHFQRNTYHEPVDFFYLMTKYVDHFPTTIEFFSSRRQSLYPTVDCSTLWCLSSIIHQDDQANLTDEATNPLKLMKLTTLASDQLLNRLRHIRPSRQDTIWLYRQICHLVLSTSSECRRMEEYGKEEKFVLLWERRMAMRVNGKLMSWFVCIASLSKWL